MDLDKDYLRIEYLDKGRSLSSIAKDLGISAKLLYYYIKKFNLTGFKSKSTLTVDSSKFNFKDPVFCYYAGLVATDGYIDYKNNRVSVRVNNEGSYEVLTAIKKHFYFTGEVRTYHGNNDLTICSRDLISVLQSFNIEGSKNSRSFNVCQLLLLTEDCQRMFIRGVLDGDGNIHLHKSKYTGKYVGGSFRISMKSLEFIENIIYFINTKFQFNYGVTIQNHKYPKLEMHVSDSKTLYSWIYTNNLELKFLDKYNKYLLIG